ncbi:hypothetical protein CTAYLR_009998 [Chrysophaeum taylorii]|uniref:RanBP2-type domain-containing protein n=1 Tax=Chrysophaeum taylorii TaxID=2483200 RepID=A0AAD7UBR9_9STRA|nr:hypothetical protein CTAYLR_009998 [Chrysophaeum taylorii]
MEDVEMEIALAVSRADFEAAAAAKRTEWSCARCTLDNPASAGRCEACLADREAPFVVAAPPTERRECGLPGCVRPAWRGFCSEEHRRRALRRRLAAPASDDEERCFVGPDGDFSVALLTRQSPRRQEIAQHFVKAWRKSAPPIVKHVLRVSPSPALVERFERYAAAVGNVRLRYHGTSSLCDFGVDLAAAPCDNDDCALCSILARGFELARAGTGPNIKKRGLRYGRGIYLSATSGKSNDYAFRTERPRRASHGRHERWRAIFVCSVAAGKAFKTTAPELHLDRPPPGYDSVVGEVGDYLNYDELVVYTEAAVLPNFIIIYAFPGKL